MSIVYGKGHTDQIGRKKGGQAMVRNYRVIGIFGKHYHTWFPEFEEKQVVSSPRSTTWKTYSKKYIQTIDKDDEVDGAVRLRGDRVKKRGRVESKGRVSCRVTGRCTVS